MRQLKLWDSTGTLLISFGSLFLHSSIYGELKKMAQEKQQEVKTHKIGVYLWIWALLFVFSFFSYMVDYLNFEGLLRWTLIVFFMLSKAALIMAIFMHLFWERYVIVNVLLWPMTLMLLFVGIMAAESEYTLFTRLFYFVAGS